VEAEKSGLFVTYRLADDQVCEFLRSLRLLAETRLTEVRETTRERGFDAWREQSVQDWRAEGFPVAAGEEL